MNRGRRIRWAELDIGRNSPSPWTIPKNRLWKRVTAASLAYIANVTTFGKLKIRRVNLSHPYRF